MLRVIQTAVWAVVTAGLVLSATGAQGEKKTPLDPSRFTDDTCKNCHVSSELPKVDFSNPECVECHTVPDEEYGAAAASPHAVAVKSPGPANSGSHSMVSIPAGEFLMGNNGRTQAEGAGDTDETPAHPVYVDRFMIDVYEVTNAQFQAFTDATGHRTPIHWKLPRPGKGSGLTFPPEKSDHPVVYVDWFDANDYCRWAGKRLPSEAEWEKAARGTDGRIFPWGNAFDPARANTPQHWLVERREGNTLPVGRFENGKSPYGLYDMAGNVYEWTASWYKPYPGNVEFNAHYGEKNKILRGGSWYDCLSYGCGLSAPSYNRSRFAPEIRNKGFGFRCAKTP